MLTPRRSIFWLILLRFIVVTSLFVSAVIIQFSTSEFLPLSSFYHWILASYFLGLSYLLLYVLDRHYAFQASLQIAFDLFLITALVYITGGLTGAFYFLYIFAIIASSLVLTKRAAYVTAALSAIFFGLLVEGLYYGIIPYFRAEQYRELSFGLVLFTIFTAWSVFFVIAFLVNYLAGKVRITARELKLAQKELEIKERQAAAGKISAQIAHEIRNPLAAISGSAQVLKNELYLSDEQRGLMSIIIKESERVSQTLEQFLNLASPEKEEFSEVNLSALMEDVLAMLKVGGELDGRHRILGNYPNSGVQYYGSFSQIKQIFWNITKNALAAMPKGGNLTIDFIPNKSRKIFLKFKDTGRGMSEEEKNRIFEPFYSRFEKGRGLGMAVVRRIVDDYEGTIRVESEEGMGTVITISLPRRERPQGIRNT